LRSRSTHESGARESPGEPGRTRALPHITTNDLAGLLEYLAGLARPEADLYQIAADLKIDSDHLLRLAEAAELFGFATIARGDITLTPLGETVADASIQVRKEIFASRMRRLPIYRWLAALLREADRQQLKAGVVQRALEIEFPPAEATRQLDTLVSWGRYAELLGYDDSSEMITLESVAAPGSGDGGVSTAPSAR